MCESGAEVLRRRVPDHQQAGNVGLLVLAGLLGCVVFGVYFVIVG